jgi:hypothetical protein
MMKWRLIKIDKETQEAIDFISEEPSCDDFVNRNLSQFMNDNGDADDNTMENWKYWEEQLHKVFTVIDKLKSQQQ